MKKFVFLFIFILVFSTAASADSKVKKFFEELSINNMDLIDEFYASDVRFIDPIVTLETREELKAYYASMYSDTESVSFVITSEVIDGNEHVVAWDMTYTTRQMNRGKPINVSGVSHIRFNKEGKAVYHRDYFDMGAMFYKHVPFVRGMVNMVDKRIKKKHDPPKKRDE